MEWSWLVLPKVRRGRCCVLDSVFSVNSLHIFSSVLARRQLAILSWYT